MLHFPPSSSPRGASYAQEVRGEAEALAIFGKPGDGHVDDEELAAPERRDVREKSVMRFGDGP